MGHVHTNGQNSNFIEDALMMCNQSSDQDSSLEDEKVKKEDRPFSSHLSAHSGTIQVKKNLAVTLHYYSKWKTRQDAIDLINLAQAQD